MTLHDDGHSRRDLSPAGDAAPPPPAGCAEKRRPALAWATVIIPPLAMLAAIGLGAYIDSLTLGPAGFLVVLILIGPGGWAAALGSAFAIIAYLSQGSLLTRVVLWIVEIALCIFRALPGVPAPGRLELNSTAPGPLPDS